MTSGTVVTGALHRVQRGHRKGFAAEPGPAPVRAPARVAIMLALASKLREAIASGRVHDQAEAARHIGVTPPRLTQLLELLRLAPDLQERVLFLEAVDGIEPLTERRLRQVTREPLWARQRALFAALIPGAPTAVKFAHAGHG